MLKTKEDKMKKIINAVAGDGKNTSPARKYTVYAALITAIALALVLIILVVSSVVIALTDGGSENTPTGDNASADNDGGSVSSSAVQYKTVTADELADMTDSTDVSIQDKRSVNSSSDDKYYYAMSGDTLKSDVQKAVDAMLVAYYKEKSTVVFVGGAKQSSNSTGFVVEIRQDANSFSEAKAISNDSTYKWIYDNAYKYGFIYEENSFTYVGTAVSTYMKTKNIATVDKLITALGGKAVSVSVTAAGASKATAYQIYYLGANGDLKVPTNYEYEVVANGTDGYFVIINTAKKTATATTGTAVG